MKISLNQIRYYQQQYQWSGDTLAIGVDALVEKIGSQLGAVEAIENLGEKYQGVVIAKIVQCHPHEDSDHLNVCLIDDGGVTADVERDENGLVQVVCGAPNVREGLLVAWLPPGSTVPESVGKDPFVLGARELRGVMSNGMLASARELALGDNHEGILEIDADAAKPGDDFAKTFGLDDYIIDLENKMFTHRPDCFGMMGIARELAGIQGIAFKSPDWYSVEAAVEEATETSLPVTVRNELPDEVPRFLVLPMSGIQVGPSPLWLQINLLRLGVRPINNVVDITNYYMLLTGQPSHAYDYDKIKALSEGEAASIVIRNPRPGEKLKLLNGKEIEPRAEAIMIASDQALIGLAGVMGGSETEVDENTKNIIIEVATFDMYSVRRTSMTHGVFTDALTRFNKGQSPLQNQAVMGRLVDDMKTLAHGEVAGELLDDSHVSEQAYQRKSVHPPVPITAEFVNSRLGVDLSADAMKTLLENVEFTVVTDNDTLTITAPFWRTDIETREDIVEEIGRLYGYDKLPLVLPRRSIKPVAKDALFTLKQQVRDVLSKAGANEVLNYSFVHGDLLAKSGQDAKDAFRVGNALSPDLQYYRLSLTPSLLEKIHPNIKAGYDEFALFEIGKAHNVQHASDDNGLPMEFEMLDLVYSRSDKFKKTGAAYYEARNFLRRLANQFGIELEFRPIDAEENYPVVKPYDHKRSAKVFVKGTDLPLGMVGEYKASVRKALKLPVQTAGFGIGLMQLQQAAAEHETIKWYTPLPRFPKVSQDITLKVAADLAVQPLFFAIKQSVDELKPSDAHALVSYLDIYQRQDDMEHKQITLRLTIASYERTLTDKEVNRLLDQVAEAAQTTFGAERV